jgi:serine/threonine protein kinase/WD40 repeat protein
VLSEDFPVPPTGFRSGSLVAGYRLQAQVGVGGMAVVFQARDERLGRPVALKILAPALAADPAFRRRFIAESRAAARVDDPHIIPIHEAGEFGGALFIAMRFVQGGDLRGVLDREGPLPGGRAAELISPVASALDAAHAAGLVHRDVKPGNILVDARPGRPDHVYLSDFGIAKGAVSGSLTGAGQGPLGTPDYEAPEQIAGQAVDGRTDQYALACVAYQLLTGAVPFERDHIMSVLYAHRYDPPPSLVSRRPDLPGAVDQVLARALAKVPEKRYESCGHFADALREALGLAPYSSHVSASAPHYPQPQMAVPQRGSSGSATGWTVAVSADPLHAATIDSVRGGESEQAAVTPAAAVNMTGLGRRRSGADWSTREPGNLTADAGVPANTANTLRAGQRAWSDPGYGGDRAQPARRPGRREVHRSVSVSMTVWIRQHRLLASAVACLVLGVAGVIPFVLASSPSSRTLGSRIPSYSRVATLIKADDGKDTVESIAFSPSGATLAAADSNGRTYLWNVATKKLAATLTDPHSLGVLSFAFSPSGATLATADGNGSIYLWNVATKKLAATITAPYRPPLSSVAFSPDGATLAAAAGDGSTFLWNLATKQLAASFDDNNQDVYRVEFTPDGATLVGYSGDRTYFWNLATEKLAATLTVPDSNSNDLGWTELSPDGATLATGAANGRTYLWNVATRKLTATLTVPNGKGVNWLEFSPDSATLAVADANGRTYLWNVAAKKLAATLTDPNSKGVNWVGFSPDGRTLAAFDIGGSTHLWNLATKTLTATLTDPNSQGASWVAFSPDGRTLAISDNSGSVCLWQAG